MHDTLYTENLSSSRAFYAKSEANCCKHVRAGQGRVGRQAGSRRKAALKNMFSFEGKHDASEIVHNKTREI